jgi:hypothetical protein
MLWVSSIFLVIAAIGQILSFAAPYWAFDGIHFVGLWKYGRCLKEDHKHCYQMWHVEYFVSGLL